MRFDKKGSNRYTYYLKILLFVGIVLSGVAILITYYEISNIKESLEELTEANEETKEKVSELYEERRHTLLLLSQQEEELDASLREVEAHENRQYRKIETLKNNLEQIASLCSQEEAKSIEYSTKIYNVNEALVKATKEFTRCKSELFENEEEWKIFQQRKNKLRKRMEEHKKLAEPYLFIHIAKTGGTSLISAIKQTWKSAVGQFWSAPRNELEVLWKSPSNPAYLGGHICYGFHKWLDLIYANPHFFDLPFSARPSFDSSSSPSPLPLLDPSAALANPLAGEVIDGDEVEYIGGEMEDYIGLGDEDERMNGRKRAFEEDVRRGNVNKGKEFELVRVKESKLREGEDYTYFTVMREPISRVLSHYNYHYFRLDDPNHWRTANKSLAEWLIETKYSHNAMTVYIGGFEHYAWWNAGDYSLLPKNNDPPNHYVVTEQHYHIARSHLLRFGLVGLQEKFDESLHQMNVMMGMQKEVMRLNSGESNHKIVPTDEDIELIKSLNQYDIKLYKLALALFKQQQDVLTELFQ